MIDIRFSFPCRMSASFQEPLQVSSTPWIQPQCTAQITFPPVISDVLRLKLMPWDRQNSILLCHVIGAEISKNLYC